MVFLKRMVWFSALLLLCGTLAGTASQHHPLGKPLKGWQPTPGAGRSKLGELGEGNWQSYTEEQIPASAQKYAPFSPASTTN